MSGERWLVLVQQHIWHFILWKCWRCSFITMFFYVHFRFFSKFVFKFMEISQQLFERLSFWKILKRSFEKLLFWKKIVLRFKTENDLFSFIILKRKTMLMNFLLQRLIFHVYFLCFYVYVELTGYKRNHIINPNNCIF